MKRLLIEPVGWPCTLAECPPGHFVHEDALCFKSEYNVSKIEAFCESGEYFCGGTSTKEERDKLIVQPVESIWEED